MQLVRPKVFLFLRCWWVAPFMFGSSKAGASSVTSSECGDPLPQVPPSPLPGELRTCWACHRTNRDKNPCPARHNGPYLVFATASQCLPCRNYHRGPLKHVTAEVLREKLKAKENQDSYNEGLRRHEELFNSSGGKQLRGNCGGRVSLPTFLVEERERAMEDTVFHSYFWLFAVRKKRQSHFQ